MSQDSFSDRLRARALCRSAAQDAPGPSDKKVTYSPYPKQNFPDQVFFGDTHLHTTYSTDAGMVGNTLGPDDAYRFARGETVTSSTGLPARLRRPLDFLVVADHSENLGLAPADRGVESGAAEDRVRPQDTRPGQGR